MKLFFVSRLFDGVAGGVERTIIDLMNEMVGRGHEVVLMSWDLEGATAHYQIDPAIRWHKLGIGDANVKAGFTVRLRRQLAMRALLRSESPDVVVAFQDGPFRAIALAAVGLGIPLVAAERNAPARFDHLAHRHEKWFAFGSLHAARRIAVQLESYISAYPVSLRDRMVAIPNPVHAAEGYAAPLGSPDGELLLLCVARLSFQKNQEVLIDAYASLASRFGRWKLVLVGAGESEQKLKHQVRQLDLEGQVQFVGPVADVDEWYRRSHLFVLPSRFEGFPNALAEAMARGLPAIGFASCAGVNELIRPGVTGLLSEGNGDAASLAESLAILMEDDKARARMGAAAVPFTRGLQPATIFDRWEGVLHDVAEAR